jgi:hypothetical protein
LVNPNTTIEKLATDVTNKHKIWSSTCLYLFASFYNSVDIGNKSQFSMFINPLKTKPRPLYLKVQSVPRCKHFSTRL